MSCNKELKINTDESDELEIDTDELKIDADELKIDINQELKITFDRLDELLRTVEKLNLATFRRVNFIYDVNLNDPDIDKLELRTARFLGSLPQLQTLQLDRWASTGRLLQQTITEATVTSFRELKTVIWDTDDSRLDELLPLWTFPVEHIEVKVEEPVSRPGQYWPAPTFSLRRLNLHRSSITDRTLWKLLSLSPCLELLRYDHLCHADCKLSSFFGLCLV
jgi:hypothetical protein